MASAPLTRDFRDEYGEEMSVLFRDRSSDGAGRLWLQVLGDLLVQAPREHWSMLKQDLRYAIWMLLRGPTFAATIIATLAPRHRRELGHLQRGGRGSHARGAGFGSRYAR